MTELNVPLLRKTMEYIETHPYEWDQEFWANTWNVETHGRCGTTMCFAGTAAFLAGAKLDLGRDQENCTTPEGDRLAIEDYAAQQLGLSTPQANYIFYSNFDDPAKMRKHVEEVVGEKL